MSGVTLNNKVLQWASQAATTRTENLLWGALITERIVKDICDHEQAICDDNADLNRKPIKKRNCITDRLGCSVNFYQLHEGQGLRSAVDEGLQQSGAVLILYLLMKGAFSWQGALTRLWWWMRPTRQARSVSLYRHGWREQCEVRQTKPWQREVMLFTLGLWNSSQTPYAWMETWLVCD